MTIEYKPIEQCIPYDRNPRDTRDAVDKVAASIQAFGFLVPIILDKDGIIIAGHTRLLAARKLGLKEVPTTTVEDLTEDEIKAYRLVDNRVAEMAVWDMPLLAEAMSYIGDEIDMLQFGFSNLEDERVQQIDTNTEYDLQSFDDEAFEYDCPECGYHFNEV